MILYFRSFNLIISVIIGGSINLRFCHPTLCLVIRLRLRRRHHNRRRLLRHTLNRERYFKKGRSAVANDFSRAFRNWCDAPENIPEEEFDGMYLDMITILEKYVLEIGWKNIFTEDYRGISELATMVKIYSLDRYELLPELVRRIGSLGDVKNFEHVNCLCTFSIEFAKKHFVINTYLDSYSNMCIEIMRMCDTINHIEGEIFAADQSIEKEKNLNFLSILFKSTLSELSNAMDNKMKKMTEEQMYKIGFEWFDSSERPYLDNIDELYIDTKECLDSESREPILTIVKPDIDGFIESYMNYPNKQ